MVSTLDPTIAESQKKVWFFSQPIDLLCCCGGLLWIVIAIYNFTRWLPESEFQSCSERALSCVLLAGTFAFTYPHQAATWARLYGCPETRRKYALCSTVAPLILLSLSCVALAQPWLIPWMARVALIWNIQHWVAQCYGIGSIYLSRTNFSLSSMERRSVWLACQMLILLAVAQVLAYPQLEPSDYFGIPVFPITFITVEAERVITAGCRLGLAIIATFLAVRFIKQKRFPSLPVVLLYATIFKVTLMSFGANLYLWFFGLPFFHGLQYLVITTTFHAKEKSLSASSTLRLDQLWSPELRRYYGKLFIFGAIAYAAVPRLLEIAGVPAPNAEALVILTLNLHHVFTDAFIWKLKDPNVRKLL